MENNTVMNIKVAFTAAVGVMTSLWGWFGWLVVVWVGLMLADWLVGSAAAAKEGRWSSAKLREGAWHKGGMVIIVVVALVGVACFKEKLNKRKLLALGVILAALVLLNI